MSSRVEVPKGFRLHEGFISRETETALMAQFEQAEKEANDGHYDGFTFMDPEAFDNIFIPTIEHVFARMRMLNAFPTAIGRELVVGCTMIGYEVDGFIKRHVDSDALSGDVVCVLSMGSAAVLNFYRDGTAREYQAVVPPRSLYIMGGESRYKWSHELKPGPWVVQGKKIPRTRRFAMVFYEPGPLYNGELLRY